MTAAVMDSLAPAQRMLDAVVSYWATQGWSLPDRRYLAAGSPLDAAMDDEHFLIGLDRITPGASDTSGRGAALPSRGVGQLGVPRASYVARLMRCVSGVNDDGEAPSAAQITSEAEVLMRDPARLLTALMYWREHEPFSVTAPNATVTVGQVDTLGPMGFLAGCTVVVTLAPIQ